jgi:murein L,D-transpeptidase YafK
MRALRALLLVGLSALPCVGGAAAFLDQQLTHPRVSEAFGTRRSELAQAFARQKLPFPPRAILIRAFKREGELELWAAGEDGHFQIVRSYPICAASGGLGPKEREGDGQVPEGFYSVSVFNPASQFHLSLGVSYPNAADRARTGDRRPGGAIMIHGDCVTIGCLPLTDPLIEEVYLAAVLARDGGQQTIPIQLFPARMDEAGWARLQTRPETTPALLRFWAELRPGYEAFEKSHLLPSVRISGSGHYVVTPR